MKNLLGIILLVVGIGLIGYGINHMDSAGSQIKELFGQEDSTGMICIVIGGILAIAGVFAVVRKK